MKITEEIKANMSHEEYLKALLHNCNKFLYFHSKNMMQQGEILRMLSQGSKTQKELQESLGVQPASISELITKLENKGLVTRARNAEDRRLVTISITEFGMKSADKISQKGAKKEAVITLPDEELSELIYLLEKLHANLNENNTRI